MNKVTRRLKCNCKNFVIRSIHFHISCRRCRKWSKKNVKDLGMRVI